MKAARIERVAGKDAAGLLRFLALVLLLVLAYSSQAGARDEEPSETIPFDIPRQRADLALIEFAEQADVTFIFPFEEARRKNANRLVGRYARDEAIRILLAGTGLRPEFDEHGALAVHSTGTSTRKGDAMYRKTNQTGKRTLASVVAAILSVFTGPHARGQEAQDGRFKDRTQDVGIEEVIVTAQKRQERLTDVPVPVTALDAESLVSTNQLRLQDYYAQVPGLNYSMDNRGASSMAIRGVTTGAFVSPTIGVTIDDVPFGSTVVVSSFSPAPDVDANEVERIEVLRGPQGTLYGASSIGGLIKYVLVDPSTDAISGNLQTGVHSIRNGEGVGYSASAAVNVPVSETFALRASGFTREDPGYIDNIATGEDGVNEVSAQGGRLSVLWRPSEATSFKINAFLQRSRLDGSAQVDSSLGDLENGFLKGTGGYDRKVQAYSATVTARIGSADFTSLTGYGRSTSSDSYDVSSALGGLTDLFYGIGGVAWADQGNETTKFSQEFRLAMPLTDRIAWRFGLFYTDERSRPDGGYILIDPVTSARGPQIFDQRIRSTYEEYAAFTDFTVQLTDRFDVQLGGRQSRNEQTNVTSTLGVPPLFADSSQPEATSSDDSFTYLLTPRYRISPGLMVYARLASGYRPGGPNIAAFAGGIPASFGPDKTDNYEIGTKGSFLDQRLVLDASAYYIRWRDIQLGQIDSSFTSYTDNGGRARSRGFELSIEARSFSGTRLSAWAVWNEAELTEGAPATSTAITARGDRLPYSSRFSANLSLHQGVDLGAGIAASFGGTVTYVGDRAGEFPSIFSGTPARQRYPSFTRANLNAEVRYRDWTANLFVNNLTDKRGVLGGGLGVIPPFAFNYIQPRTIGLSVSRSF